MWPGVRPRFIRVHFNILARTIRRPKTRYATSSTTLVHNNVLKHLLTIGKQFLGSLPSSGLLKIVG